MRSLLQSLLAARTSARNTTGGWSTAAIGGASTGMDTPGSCRVAPASGLGEGGTNERLFASGGANEQVGRASGARDSAGRSDGKRRRAD